MGIDCRFLLGTGLFIDDYPLLSYQPEPDILALLLLKLSFKNPPFLMIRFLKLHFKESANYKSFGMFLVTTSVKMFKCLSFLHVYTNHYSNIRFLTSIKSV